MNAIQSKAILTGICFLFIFITGFWLSRSGKPYPGIVFTLHKLITLGIIIYLSVRLYQANQSAPLRGEQAAAIALMAACFLVMLVTGGLLSVDKALPAVVHHLHQILPYLTAASVGITLYLTFFARAVP